MAEDQELYAEKLAAFSAEVYTLALSLEAEGDGLISRKELDSITSLKPEVSVSEKRVALHMYVHSALQEKLSEFESFVLACKDKSEILQAGIRAVKKRIIKTFVLNHLTSLNALVPVAMRQRYLLTSAHASLTRVLKKYEKEKVEAIDFNKVMFLYILKNFPR